MKTETITWHELPADGMPDAETTVGAAAGVDAGQGAGAAAGPVDGLSRHLPPAGQRGDGVTPDRQRGCADRGGRRHHCTEGCNVNHTKLIASLSAMWAQLDAVDEWRPVIRNAIDVLAAPAAGAPVERMIKPLVWARKDQLQHASTRGGLMCAMYPNTDRRADLQPLYDQAALDAALNLWPRDCRLCANFTTKTGGCVSVVQCVDSMQFKATPPRQYWVSAPNVLVSGPTDADDL